MRVSVEYNRFFAFSSKSKKFFNTSFSRGINIVHGKNTSGKSTLLQSLLYTFGINDEKRKLSEILSDDVIFRLDFTVKNQGYKKVSIVRDDEVISIKIDDKKPIKFIGISANHSREHTKLKLFLSQLFGFSLHLEYDKEYKPASLEALFLPYYVAQDVGWVYRHKSFRGLDFIRNFKNDFFDYYLGIINNYDRLEKSRLELEKKELEAESRVFHTIERNDINFKLAKLKDEAFSSKAMEYIEPYKENKSRLIELEKNYLLTCNKITLLEEHRKVLLRVRRSLQSDILSDTKCPTCSHELRHSIEDTYNHFQNLNDTEKQLVELKVNLKELKDNQGILNSIINSMAEKRTAIEKDYYELLDYKVDNVTLSTWLKNKVNVEMSDEIMKKIGANTSKILEIDCELAKFKTDTVVKEERRSASYKFKAIFEKYTSELKVKSFQDDRFYLLYEIPAFPRQGVELLKTLLAYNFAFVSLIKKTECTHILPLMLDAIFEGDFEDESRNDILKFISKNKPSDQQLIFSIADSKTNTLSAEHYNKSHFQGNANLICIGQNSRTRSLLTEYDGEFDSYISETISILS